MHILGLHIFDALVILIYFIALILIGVVVSRRIKNQEDFLMGGRKIGTLLQTFMNFGMATGSDAPVGAARETFRQGMAGIWVHLFTLFATPFYWITPLRSIGRSIIHGVVMNCKQRQPSPTQVMLWKDRLP
jgi:SSS family solute:Na+ symporter